MSAKTAAKLEAETAAARRGRILNDPNIESKLKSWYSKGGTFNEYLAANPASFENFFDEHSKGRTKTYNGYKIWPVWGGWKTSLNALATFATERECKQFIDTWVARHNPAAAKGDFQQCVDAVSAKGGAVDPGAVCAAMEQRKQMRAGKQHGRVNPSAAAAEVYEEFHGRRSEELVKVRDRVHIHEHLAALGALKKLVVDGVDGYRHELVGFGKAILCSNEMKNQLFIRGGSQSLDLAEFGIDHPHEIETLGEVVEIRYFTTKDHLGSEGGTALYFHKSGTTVSASGSHRKVGYGPDLIYRTRDEALEFAGGTYEIKAEGIDK